MKHDVKAPAVGESITEVKIASWKKQNGEAVKAGEVLMEIESDKATVEVAADIAGVLFITVPAGEMVKVGAVLGAVDDAAKATVASSAPAAKAAPAPSAPAPAAMAGGGGGMGLSPAVAKMTAEQGLDANKIPGTGKDGRVTKGDVISYVENGGAKAPAPTLGTPAPAKLQAGERRVPMTLLRKKIAERLLSAQHNAAILTTFNEVDMAPVNEIRNKYKEAFKAKNGVALSYMSFFTRACTLAIKELPAVNARIDGSDIIYNDNCDMGIAVGTDRGLVVPVVRGADKMTFLEIEKAIGALAVKARDGKLSPTDLSGGTFTITNGGTYGSLMSTPILNPPQSAILGMHKIMDRPMAVNGQLVIRPMMYLALSYDHRIIDGKEAVTFLVRVKEALENPTKLGLDFI